MSSFTLESADSYNAPGYAGPYADVAQYFASGSVTGGAPSFTAKIEASFYYTGHRGWINIFPKVTRHGGESVATMSHQYDIWDSQTYALKQTEWSEAISATCGVVLNGDVDFFAETRSNGVQTSRRLRSGRIQQTQTAACTAPWALYINGVPDSVVAGITVTATLSSVARAGSGTIASYEWTLNNVVQSATGTTWQGPIACGEQTIGVKVTNSVGLSSTASTKVVGTCEQEEVEEEQYATCDGVIVDDPDACAPGEEDGGGESGGGGSGDGGSGGTFCILWEIRTMETVDDGYTWYEVARRYEWRCY